MRVVGVALVVALVATVPGLWMGGVQDTLPAVGGASSDPAGGARSMEWSTRADLLDVAFEVRVSVPQPADCVLSLRAAGRTTLAGPEFVKVVQTDEGRGWSSLTSDGAAQLHVAGLVDTRDVSVQQDDGRWALKSVHRRSDVVGNVSWFFGAGHVSPWPGHDWTGADSLRSSFACDGEFEVQEVLVDRSALLVNERSLEDGQSLHVGGVGTMVRGEGVSHRMSSSQGRLVAGQSGNEGVLRFSMPGGVQETALAGADGYFRFSRGPGEYGAALDCVCRGTFWAVFADLEPVAGLDALSGATD